MAILEAQQHGQVLVGIVMVYIASQHLAQRLFGLANATGIQQPVGVGDWKTMA